MAEVEIREAGEVSIAVLMIKQIVDPFLRHPLADAILKDLTAAAAVRASDMEAGLYLDGGRVWIENGPCPDPVIKIEGALDAFLDAVALENIPRNIAAGRLKLRIYPWRAIGPARDLLRGAARAVLAYAGERSAP